MELRDKLGDTIREMVAKAQGEICLTCANFSPEHDGGCWLRQKLTLDTGLEYTGAKLLFTPVTESRLLEPSVIREIACSAYDDEEGFPSSHPQHGGWVCWACGKYLSREVADSTKVNLPQEERKCSCGAMDEYYSV